MMRGGLILILMALLLPASHVFAAVDCTDLNAVQQHENPPGTSESISYTTRSGSNLITFLGVGGRALTPPTFSNVQIGGQAMTVTPSAHSDTGEAFASIYYKVNPPAGTNNVTFDLSSNPTTGSYMIWTCTGVEVADPFRSTPVRANGVGTTITVNVTSVNTGDMIVDYFSTDEEVGPVDVGADQTEFLKGTTSSSISGTSRQDGSAGTTMSWTQPSDDWQIVAVPLKPAAATTGGGGVRRRTL